MTYGETSFFNKTHINSDQPWYEKPERLSFYVQVLKLSFVLY
ncbi:hypothetical protein QUA42_05855 [Microcoleus sp. Pol11C2]